MRQSLLWLSALVLMVSALALIPLHWYPQAWHPTLYNWFGAPAYDPPPETRMSEAPQGETPCPADIRGWRQERTIDGVRIPSSPQCQPDNPYAVAAFVKGTNNVSHGTLMESGLAPDAVVKGRDLDGDGDPDEIHIRLEVAELNGGSPNATGPVVTYPIAPGLEPGMWVFTPKTLGMSTQSFLSVEAVEMLRAPSPAIRVEQGDRIQITLENTHYMPHTIHLHGVDHPFISASGHGNDGVPQSSEVPVMPGKSRTYHISPRQSGTMFYHCHVQPNVHVLMGLQGMFVVEENRPNNWLQTLNIGAGEVRLPSKAVTERYEREYDLHYQDMDKEMHRIIQDYDDPRNIIEQIHLRYDITDNAPDYFLLNGRSFPYTLRESLVVIDEGQQAKLRVLNGGNKPLSLHTHGHKVRVTHYDGVEAPVSAQIMRDVVFLSAAQRLDLELRAEDDGLHSYGPGIWPFHDHQETGITTDGISPGGDFSFIVYDRFMANGFPETQGADLGQFFTERYYRKEVAIWLTYDPLGLLGMAGQEGVAQLRIVLLGLVLGGLIGVLVMIVRGPAPGR